MKMWISKICISQKQRAFEVKLIAFFLVSKLFFLDLKTVIAQI